MPVDETAEPSEEPATKVLVTEEMMQPRAEEGVFPIWLPVTLRSPLSLMREYMERDPPFPGEDLNSPISLQLLEGITWAPHGHIHWWRPVPEGWSRVDSNDGVVFAASLHTAESKEVVSTDRQVELLELAWREYFMRKSVMDFNKVLSARSVRLYSEEDLRALYGYFHQKAKDPKSLPDCGVIDPASPLILTAADWKGEVPLPDGVCPSPRPWIVANADPESKFKVL